MKTGRLTGDFTDGLLSPLELIVYKTGAPKTVGRMSIRVVSDFVPSGADLPCG